MSELGLSDSDSDSSVGSILGARLDGFDRESWMLDTKGAHYDIQVGEAVGVNDSGDIPRRMTGCRVGVEVVPRAQVAKPGVESRKQPSSTLSEKTVTFDPQRLAIGEQDAAGGDIEVGVSVNAANAAGQGIQLTPDEKKAKKRLQDKKKRSPSHKKKTTRAGGSSDNRDQSARHANTLSKL